MLDKLLTLAAWLFAIAVAVGIVFWFGAWLISTIADLLRPFTKEERDRRRESRAHGAHMAELERKHPGIGEKTRKYLEGNWQG